ncbi:hypothetical protein PHLGIDRAFT_74236 [Phlebiopsis gigantea 11061_1 CR5-6]|uniref:SET domain-containing protein n=1 Tax=Phlebiopsis gigantea (strain 11061_1 CR5-6) TaxID=745531 RepID=A0A0C3S599_PHLG1|nr:hypothetical protein PHLGIDRAFT_74236 [Phlebiopsis gigantea 11061_1 CR5-6]
MQRESRSNHDEQAVASPVSSGEATWLDFAALQSGELQQVGRFPELLQNHIRIYQVLKSRFSSAPPDAITIHHVRVALGVDPGNAFGVWQVPTTEESEGLGFGVYPIPSFFNHHCSPNVRREQIGRRFRFVTTKSVAAGEDLCISYGQFVAGVGLGERRKHLREGWFFECQCSRCMAEEAAQKQDAIHN